MKTAYVLKGHMTQKGTIVLDEPAPILTGPVLVTLQSLEELDIPSSEYTDAEMAELKRRLEIIHSLDNPEPLNDGLSAKDYKEILYGITNGESDVF